MAEIEATGVALTDVAWPNWASLALRSFPEVRDLAAQRWLPLHHPPLYCLLPAAWPGEHRMWVRNRLLRVSSAGRPTS